MNAWELPKRKGEIVTPTQATLSLAYLRAAFQIVPTPLAVISAHDRQLLDANPAFLSLVDQRSDQLLNARLEDFFKDVPAWSFDEPLGAEPLVLRRGGQRWTVRVVDCGESPGEQFLLAFDAGAGITLGPQLPTPEILDSLTGLATRDYFDRRLAAAAERTRQQGTPCFAVMFLDLDDFKPVNDKHGHATGDRVLMAIAERLAAAIRPGDLLSRRGGDEFTLLLEGIHHPDEARHIAERLWRQSQTPLDVDGRTLQVGMSIGIAFGDGSVTDPLRIIAAADQAMYAAKRRGAPTMHGD